MDGLMIARTKVVSLWGGARPNAELTSGGPLHLTVERRCGGRAHRGMAVLVCPLPLGT